MFFILIEKKNKQFKQILKLQIWEMPEGYFWLMHAIVQLVFILLFLLFCMVLRFHIIPVEKTK